MFWTSLLHYTLQISPPWHSCMSMVLCILKTALLRIWVTPLTESCLCVQKSSLSCLYHPFKGSIPKPELGSPPRKKIGSKSVSGLCRLSTISEQEPDMLDTNPSTHDSWGGSEWAGSSFSMCSDKFKNSSSRFSSDDSYQPDSGGITCSLSTIVDVIKLRSPETFNLLLYIFFCLVTAARWLRSTSPCLSALPLPRVNGAATRHVREGREPLFPLIQIHQVVRRERPAGKGLLQLQAGPGL